MLKVTGILAKYKVREATEPRNIRLTFDENGFYQTLKRRVVAQLATQTNIKWTRLKSDVPNIEYNIEYFRFSFRLFLAFVR